MVMAEATLDGHFVMKVVDNGDGIDPKMQGKLFRIDVEQQDHHR